MARALRERRPRAPDGAARARTAARDLSRRLERPRRRAAGAPRGLLRHERLRARAHLGPRGARLAAPGDRVRPLPDAAHAGREEAPARAPDRGGGDGALPPPRVPWSEAVLDRGPRRDGADARRADRARSRG